MPLSPGTVLGPYEIAGPLGAGGMGEVYRARDRRLNRDVAIKILPESVALDPVTLARFEREARTLAALNHPHIAQIYGLENADARGKALIMELVGGRTLAERMADGPVPIAETLEIARQIADALECAHAEGIVHRDLKPANIKVRDDGAVKVLDFGLAKSADFGGAANLQDSPTFTSPAMTERGLVLGTAAYMSPEQARGRPVDKRTDIWAFGIIVFEMLTGKQTFVGETVSDTVAAVLREDIPWSALPASTPAPVRRVLQRSLQKDPRQRLRDIGDARLEIEDAIAGTPEGGSPRAPEAARREPWLPWAIAAAALIAAGIAAWPLIRTEAASPGVWSGFTQITDSAGDETSPSLSPDGATVVFASRARGSWDLYSQRVGGRNRTLIVGDEGRDEKSPAFSPDGQQIAFHESDEDGGIFVAGATGESVRRLSNVGAHPAWSPDGRQIAFDTEEVVNPYLRQGSSALIVIDVAGGTPRVLDRGDAVQPSWSPSGNRIVFWSNDNGQRDLYTIAATGGPRVPLVVDADLDWCPVWAPDGRSIVFASDRGGSMNLWSIGIDEATGAARTAPVPITNGVQAAAECASFARDGRRLAFRSRVSAVNTVAVPFDPVNTRAGVPVVLDTSNGTLGPGAVSPDGRTLALYNLGSRQEDVFVTSTSGFAPRRVTDDAARDRLPVWSPDGRSLIFMSTRGGRWEIWSINVDGGGLRKVVSAQAGIIPVLSPAGDRLVFSSAVAGPMYIAEMAEGSSREGSVQALDGTLIEGSIVNLQSWSRDGRTLAGIVTWNSGRPAYVALYDITSKTLRRISGDETYWVRWLPDGRRLMYVTTARELIVLDTASGRRTPVDIALPDYAVEWGFELTPDARTLYYPAGRSESDIWIVESFRR